METKPAESTGTIGAAAQRMGFVSHLHPGCTCTHEAGQPCDASCAVHAPDATAKPAPATTYTIRSEGGSLTAPGSDRRNDAMISAAALAHINEGQRIVLYRDGKPVRVSGAELSWTSGPRAEVQR